MNAKTWKDLYATEHVITRAGWAEYHATGSGLDGPDPWWEKTFMWDPPLTTFNSDEISAWAADVEYFVIETLPFHGDDGNPDSEEWRDLYYLAIARTLGADAAESIILGIYNHP